MHARFKEFTPPPAVRIIVHVGLAFQLILFFLHTLLRKDMLFKSTPRTDQIVHTKDKRLLSKSLIRYPPTLALGIIKINKPNPNVNKLKLCIEYKHVNITVTCAY